MASPKSSWAKSLLHTRKASLSLGWDDDVPGAGFGLDSCVKGTGTKRICITAAAAAAALGSTGTSPAASARHLKRLASNPDAIAALPPPLTFSIKYAALAVLALGAYRSNHTSALLWRGRATFERFRCRRGDLSQLTRDGRDVEAVCPSGGTETFPPAPVAAKLAGTTGAFLSWDLGPVRVSPPATRLASSKICVLASDVSVPGPCVDRPFCLLLAPTVDC